MPRYLLDPRHFRLDDVLRRPYTPTTPFGSSGDCLWASSPQGWGFWHGVHWFHPSDENGMGPIRLALRVNGETLEPADALYRPSHITLNARDPESGLQVTEDKFITHDDVVVSVLSLRNPSDGSIEWEMDLAWGVSGGAHEFRQGISTHVHREGPPGDDLRQSIPAGARQTFVFAVAFAPSREEAVRRTTRWTQNPNPTRAQSEEYQVWFDENIPLFECSDPWLTKWWYHRWYLVRKNHFRPQTGPVPEDTFSEGRWKSAWYSATITYGAGHVLRELRWLRDSRYAQNYLRGFIRNQREDGLFRSFYLNGIARPDGDEGKYTDWITASAWDAQLVHPDTAFLREILPALERNVAYWQTHAQNDALLVVDNHWGTGMEWQPSFFAQADFVPGERRDGCDVQNPVKRLDLTSYQYANVRALAQVQRLLGNENAAQASDELADRIRAAVNAKMWDEPSGFFYDLLPATDQKLTDAKTIAAFYPFYAGMGNAENARAWAYLVNPALFWTAHPPASTARDSPAYAQDKTMSGRPLTVCCWNGPTWPHATSLVVGGLARCLRDCGATSPGFDARKPLFDLVQSLARAQFEDGDFARPYTGEYYHGDTGEWLTGERDYLHSTGADLIIGDLVGLVPRRDDVLELHPLLLPLAQGGLAYFCLQDVPYRGHTLTLVWDDPAVPEDAFGDGDKGFTVYVDARKFHHQGDLSPFTADLPS